MAKKTPLGDHQTAPNPDPRLWSQSHGTYIAGRAYVDEADLIAGEMDRKWGIDRLRLLVGPEFRERFDRQRYLFNQAIWHGDLEAVKREAQRMVKAWTALDGAAEARGALVLYPMVWEVGVTETPSGDEPSRAGAYVAAIVPTNDHARAVIAEGRKVVVYTLEEIGHLLAKFPDLVKPKQIWPGAAVVAAKPSLDDPLASVHDLNDSLDGI